MKDHCRAACTCHPEQGSYHVGTCPPITHTNWEIQIKPSFFVLGYFYISFVGKCPYHPGALAGGWRGRGAHRQADHRNTYELRGEIRGCVWSISSQKLLHAAGVGKRARTVQCSAGTLATARERVLLTRIHHGELSTERALRTTRQRYHWRHVAYR